MSSYLARLKKIENDENFNKTPNSELTKPPKDTSVSFDSAIQGENKKNSNVLKSESIEIKMIRAWLHKIGEPEMDHHLVLNKCEKDPEAKKYFLNHARGEYDE